jgi:LPPG:FO 2-phospho-L-lactate transferase
LNKYNLKIVALAGGVGGAKLAEGLAQVLPPENLTIIVNTGDDFDHLGLRICPDLDTVCYTLAGLANPDTGWGRANETWNALDNLETLGGPTWFRIGDKDLSTHLERTRRLNNGNKLSQITQVFCRSWGILPTVIPMSDEVVSTKVYTDIGVMPFQEYFVQRKCLPTVKGFKFDGVEKSQPAPGVLDAIELSDAIIICPSNPWVSIDPILGVPQIRSALAERKVIAVSPIIGGLAIKGPAAKMFSDLGIQPSAIAVAQHYENMIKGFVFDKTDSGLLEEIYHLGISPYVTDSIMRTREDRNRVAGEVLDFSTSMV